MNQNRINKEAEILLCLLKAPTHGRELATQLQEPLTSVQRVLKHLEDERIISYSSQGKNKVYSIQQNLRAKKAVYSAEHYRFVQLVKKYPHMEHILKEVVKKTKAIVIVFGSHATLTATKESDIDLFIHTSQKNLKKEVELIHSKLAVKIGDVDLSSLLIKEIIKNHVIVQGVEEFYDKTEFFK